MNRQYFGLLRSGLNSKVGNRIWSSDNIEYRWMEIPRADGQLERPKHDPEKWKFSVIVKSDDNKLPAM